MLKTIIIGFVILAGQLTMACIGGHQSKLVVQNQEIGLIDKTEKVIHLNDGFYLNNINNCKNDFATQLKSSERIDISKYFENDDLCFDVVDVNKNIFSFKVSNSELNRIARVKECGGKIEGR